MYKHTFIIILMLLTASLKAQVEGYGSVSYGYHKNPLYNYQESGDNLRQSYVELRFNHYYDYSSLGFQYTGGLMIFNKFTERDYYEHSLGTNYSFQFTRDDDDEDTSDIYNSMTFGTSLFGRQDKEIHKEFDNYAINFSAVYNNINNGFLPYELKSTFSFRTYKYLSELSNISEIVELKAGVSNPGSFIYGLKLSGGIKYYTQTVYDTSAFETKRTVTIKGGGKGKPEAKVFSDKKILIQPQSNGIHQFTAGVYLIDQWSFIMISGDFIYRYNSRAYTRYLAQYVNTSFLSEDIYNDFFTYQGPGSTIKAAMSFPFQVKFNIEAVLENKEFNVPAFDLNGEEIADKRKDLLSSADFTLTRSFEKELGLNLELSLNYLILRNQSNDLYNDFSGSFASLSLGIGF